MAPYTHSHQPGTTSLDGGPERSKNQMTWHCHEYGTVFQTCVLWPPDSWPACLAERLPVEALVKQRAPGAELDLLRPDLSGGAPGPLRAESQRR